MQDGQRITTYQPLGSCAYPDWHLLYCNNKYVFYHDIRSYVNLQTHSTGHRLTSSVPLRPFTRHNRPASAKRTAYAAHQKDPRWTAGTGRLWRGASPDGPLLCELPQSILIVIHVKRGSSLSLIALADMARGKAKTDPSKKKNSKNNGAILHNGYTQTHKHARTQPLS